MPMSSSLTGPSRARGTLYALLIPAALALSACGTVFGDDPGEADATGVTGPSGETGQVVEVISSEQRRKPKPWRPCRRSRPSRPSTTIPNS